MVARIYSLDAVEHGLVLDHTLDDDPSTDRQQQNIVVCFIPVQVRDIRPAQIRRLAGTDLHRERLDRAVLVNDKIASVNPG